MKNNILYIILWKKHLDPVYESNKQHLPAESFSPVPDTTVHVFDH